MLEQTKNYCDLLQTVLMNVFMMSLLHHPRSLSDIDRSTAANDPRPSASFSARKNPQRIPVNTLPVFPGLWPRTWPRLLRLVAKANVGQAPSPVIFQYRIPRPSTNAILHPTP